MDLQTFLHANATTQAAFARAAGVSRAYVSELISGAKRPSLGMARRIERATGGAVPMSSWMVEDGTGA